MYIRGPSWSLEGMDVGNGTCVLGERFCPENEKGGHLYLGTWIIMSVSKFYVAKGWSGNAWYRLLEFKKIARHWYIVD